MFWYLGGEFLQTKISFRKIWLKQKNAQPKIEHFHKFPFVFRVS